MNEHTPRLDIPAEGTHPVHRLFRFPAKFHAPAVAELIRRYCPPGGLLYDPFCGSGTSLVEGAFHGRDAIGADVDPLAVFVSSAKTREYDVENVTLASKELATRLDGHRRSAGEYEELKFTDITSEDLEHELRVKGDLTLPPIPRVDHWFRRYVTSDLATIRHEIQATEADDTTREALLLAFAAIIRNSSNADPVPVSGLEVTKHMRARDAAGRMIDPYALYRTALKKVVTAIADVAERRTGASVEVYCNDATQPILLPRKADAVVTSPPYHNAVDYYRRHQLEMYWLGLVGSQEERLAILPRYIGRHRIPQSHPVLHEEHELGPLASAWESKMREKDASRANDLRHYLISMEKVFAALHFDISAAAPVVMVVGKSVWQGEQIPTDELLAEAASKYFRLREGYWYPVSNRYMSYSRKNLANIDEEHVLVFEKV